MQHITFSDNDDSLKYAILIKSTSLLKASLIDSYIKPLEQLGIPRKEIVVVGVSSAGKKLAAKEAKEKLALIVKGLDILNIKHVLVAHSELFKYAMKVTKTTNLYGTINKGKFPGYEDIELILSIDYNALIYNDSLSFKLENSLTTFYKAVSSQLRIEKDIIHSSEVPFTLKDIKAVLQKLYDYPALTCDIETTSLRFEQAQIATIAFAWDKHNGVMFSVDTQEEEAIHTALKVFFRTYQGKLIFHGGLFDCKVLIYQIMMDDDDDLTGMHIGLKTFQSIEDSMLVTYLATNSTHETPLGLKENSFEFSGDYGIEFDDEHSVNDYPREEVLEYNLKDCLSTWFVYEKFYPKMVADNQETVYKELMLPSIMPLLYMMLIGMPLDIEEVHKADKMLSKMTEDALVILRNVPSVIKTIEYLRRIAWEKDFADRYGKAKKPENIKRKDYNTFPASPFNPNSPKQVTTLLYEILGLPILYRTATGAPSADGNTLKVLTNYAKSADAIITITQLQEIASISTVLSSFIKKFSEIAYHRPNDTYWLNGNLKLGGTQSGRLSSNSPNMQNIPSNSKYGKLVKKCFRAPDGWLIAGADFASLEDRINALLTQDPNKIKVYTDGYDGHCLRAYSYFGDQMSDIIDTVESVNSIEDRYPMLRQDSKAPTFALTYLGTWHTLVKNLGITKEEAKSIENRYHNLYKVSGEWSEEQIRIATEQGYVECAFGLRLRTPILGQTIRTSRSNLQVAEAEGRSAVNAISQSWGMLINRTAIVVINKLLDSEFYDRIFPLNTIHDSIYFLVADDPEVIQWLNNELIEAMEWNDHPLIKSDDVPMGANLELGITWAKQHKLANNASIDEIELLRTKIYDN